jgi:secondary thiamine-phosphate synthase enzyme
MTDQKTVIWSLREHWIMFRKTLRISTHGEGEIIDITPDIGTAVRESGVKTGLVNIFVTGSTAAITTIEYENGVLDDFRRSLSVIAPDAADYAHNTRWGDGNGRSHVKASFIGPSITIPVEDGALMCGTWQQVVFVELDVRPERERTAVVTVSG